MEKCPFSERFLQIIWNERLLAPQARCTSGETLHVLSTGLWNRMAGPDFRDAAVVIGSELQRGDVEVHCASSAWRQHGHAEDPRYQHVILHVVWEDDGDGPPLPTLELRGQLQPSWRHLLQKIEAAFYPYAREVPPGACAVRWALTEDGQLREILLCAGFSRMLRRGQRLLRLAARLGDDQALYEQVFEGLGYSANREPFRQLAHALPLENLPDFQDANLLLSRFFGMAGLLPDVTQSPPLPEFAPFLSQAWRNWWESGLTSLDLPWNFAGSRPLNSIHRRLAGGVFWLQQCGGRPAQWLHECLAAAQGNPRQLLKRLLAPPRTAAGWEAIQDFGCRLPRPAALLGRERMADLAVNAFLPYLLAHADLQNDSARRDLVRAAWESLPRGQENHLLKDAIRRFLSPPSRATQLLQRTAHQQGMMDIFQNFCLALDHACRDCPFVVQPPDDFSPCNLKNPFQVSY